MEMMDTDHDRPCIRGRARRRRKEHVRQMDANGDGTVTASEMDAAQHAMKSGDDSKDAMSSAEKIRVIDTNGDGALSSDEHEAGSRSMFQKMDSDHDGALTVEEIASGHAAMLKKA
jgi:Ca2+-binding EF-hand superfamily protein